MLNEQELLDNGFRRCPAGQHRSGYCDFLYQKTFWVDEAGEFVGADSPARDKKAFFLNVWHYPATRINTTDVKESFCAEARMYCTFNGVPFEYDLEAPFLRDEVITLAFVEKFFTTQYRQMAGVPDRHNND